MTEKQHEVTRWNSEKYADTTLDVIPTEIARCFFNINSDMVTYNQFDGRMIECKDTKPEKYEAENWNYLFLINVLDRFMAETVIPDTEQIRTKLFERILGETLTLMLNASESRGYTYNYNL